MRKILKEVVSGKVSPKEAVRKLVELKWDEGEAREFVLAALGGGDIINEDKKGRKYFYTGDQKADRLYVGSDGWPISKTIRFIWRKWKSRTERLELAHGLCVYDRNRAKDDQIIAFVDGFQWYNGISDKAVVYTIHADRQTPESVLQELRTILNQNLKPHSFPTGKMTPRLEIVANA